jgi:2-polyprenyl-6-hydroxyphenyl methylase/3-demethylubiquinone-9 3-methyltransferase
MTVSRRAAKERFYDTIADRFDEVVNRYDLGRRIEIVFDEMLAGESLAGRRLLDVGCGTGWFAQRAVSHGARVAALDIGARLLAKTREKCDASLVAADACRLPFPNGAFDIVVSSECIEHTQEPLRAVAEMCRILKPGGSLVITVPNKFWRLSATFAAIFKLRPYEGLENWLWWWELRSGLRKGHVRIVAMFGFHLFPPLVAASWPFLRSMDRFGARIGPVMVNLAVKAVKPASL